MDSDDLSLFTTIRRLRGADPVWPAVTIAVMAEPTDPELAKTRLRSQMADVGRQLDTALLDGDVDAQAKRRRVGLGERLDALAARAETVLEGRDGVVILLADTRDGTALDEVVGLGHVATDRTSVASRLALADLIRTANRTSHVRVLVIAEQDARILEGAGGALAELRGHGFPHTESGPRGKGVGVGHSRRGDSAHADAKRDEWLRDLDRKLADVIAADGDLPLVVVAIRDYVDAFTAVRKTTSDILGHVDGSHGQTHVHTLAGLVGPVVDVATAERVSAAIAEVQEAKGANRFIGGIDELFAAATEGRLATAVLDDGAVVPAALTDDGRLVTDDIDTTRDPAGQSGIVAVYDDVLDEIAGRAAETGSRVVFTTDLDDAEVAVGAVRW